MGLVIKNEDVGVVKQPNEEYITSNTSNIILGKSDQWIQWYRNHCYPGSWQRTKLNARRKRYYIDNKYKILALKRLIYLKTVIH